MDNKIEVFKNEQFGEVRTILEGETLLFCGSDVARALGYAIPSKAGLAVWGVVNLMEGYGNDNPGAKSQGIKQLMAGGGVVVIGTTLIPLLSGLF